MKHARWEGDRLAALYRSFMDLSLSREACAEMFGIGKKRLLQIGKKHGWLDNGRRPSRGPIRYLVTKGKLGT